MPKAETPRIEGLGHRLVRLRQERGLSLRDLAQRAGVAHQTIYDMEAGKKKPTADRIEKIADALGVSPAWLAYGVGPVILRKKSASGRQGP